ncbi:hypothetical protein [Streptomyces tubercidicus]|uniref:hypothetical protein n=1 Tax=Streptomyces tubercidicus TaxID=47759 RepID=UPI002E0FB7F1|nr:hypothetical protein OG761_04440 [Streptomyces tubercidicus]
MASALPPARSRVEPPSVAGCSCSYGAPAAGFWPSVSASWRSGALVGARLLRAVRTLIVRTLRTWCVATWVLVPGM